MDSWPCRSIRRRPHFRPSDLQNEPDISATRHVSVRRSAGGKNGAANSSLGAPVSRHLLPNPPVLRHCCQLQHDHRHSVRWIATNGFGGLSGAKRPGNQPILEIHASSKEFLLAHNCNLNQHTTTREPAALLSCRPKSPTHISAQPSTINASTPTIQRVRHCPPPS
jgi:hypothetical protein